jgi:CcdB protein
MKQFGVYENARGNNAVPYFLVLQSAMATSLDVVVAAPIEHPKGPMLPFVHVPLLVQSQPFIALINELAALPAKRFGAQVADLSEQEAVFKRALDFIFFGI